MLLLSAATEAAVSVILQPLGQVIAGVALRGLRARKGTGLAASPGSVVFSYVVHMCRGVVVRERGGAPFRQILWSRNGAPANVVGHRWNANTEAFRQFSKSRRTR